MVGILQLSSKLLIVLTESDRRKKYSRINLSPEIPVEEKILQLQKHKMKLSESLINTEESIVKSLTREDIEMMLN